MESRTLNVVSGCAGIGGIDLGLHWTGRFKTICYIEREDYPIAVLLNQMRQGNLDTAPIWTDFQTFDGRPWRGVVDLFVAGIPCQPHSLAGKRSGKSDERNLWPDMARITREMEPRYIIVENVPGLFVGDRPYGLEIVGELQAMGYLVFKFNLSAAAVGANHRRDRIFILGTKVADSNQFRFIHRKAGKPSNQERNHAQCKFAQSCTDLSHSSGKGLERRFKKKRSIARCCRCDKQGYWSSEPNVGRVVDGAPARVDRIKALGNAVVPQVAHEVGKIILDLEAVSVKTGRLSIQTRESKVRGK